MSADQRAISPGAWAVFVALIVATFVARGVMLACIIPPLEMWDEYQHIGYIASLSQSGQTPVYPLTPVPRSVVQQTIRFPLSPSAFEQLVPFGGRPYPFFWNRPPTPPELRASSPPLPPLYEAQHPPTYYWLMEPIWRAFGPAAPIERPVAALRLLNVLFAAAALALILCFVGATCLDRRHAMLLALWISLQPLLLLNAVRVANDALAFLLGTTVVVWTLHLLTRVPPRFAWESAAVGVLSGLAILTKATSIPLVPFVDCCLLLAVIAGRLSLRAGLLSIALHLAATVAIVSPLLVWNWRHYHLLIPVQQALINRAHHLTLLNQLHYVNTHLVTGLLPLLNQWIVTDGLWLGGWSFLRPLPFLTVAYAGLLIAATFGWPLGWVFRRERSVGILNDRLVLPAILLLNVLVYLALMAHAVQALLAWGYDGTWPWYAQIATPWLLLAVGVSSMGYRNSSLRYTLTMAVPLLFVLTEWLCTWGVLAPHAAQLPLGPAMLRRLSLFQPPLLGTRTMIIAAAISLSSTAVVFGWSIFAFWPADWRRYDEDHSSST